MVNPAILERILNDIRSELKELRSATDISWEVYRADKRARRFVERTLHVLIEACLDAAQHIISDDGFREPTSYRDAFAVLAENNVIPAESLERFENMAAFRNLLVHYYERIDDAIVFDVFQRHLADFEAFAEYLVDYLNRVQPG